MFTRGSDPKATLTEVPGFYGYDEFPAGPLECHVQFTSRA